MQSLMSRPKQSCNRLCCHSGSTLLSLGKFLFAPCTSVPRLDRPLLAQHTAECNAHPRCRRNTLKHIELTTGLESRIS